MLRGLEQAESKKEQKIRHGMKMSSQTHNQRNSNTVDNDLRQPGMSFILLDLELCVCDNWLQQLSWSSRICDELAWNLQGVVNLTYIVHWWAKRSKNPVRRATRPTCSWWWWSRPTNKWVRATALYRNKNMRNEEMLASGTRSIFWKLNDFATGLIWPVDVS